MPPKRKRATEAAVNTEESAPAPKKRTTTVKASSTRSTRKVSAPEPSGSSTSTTASAAKKKGATSTAIVAAPPPPPKDLGAYSDQKHSETFAVYADPEDPKVMSSDGVQQLFVDAGIELEGVVPFLLAWTMKAKELGLISLEEWKTLKELKIDRPSKLQVAMNDLAMLFYPNYSPSATAVTDPEPAVAPKAGSKSKGKKTTQVPSPVLATLNGSAKDVYNKHSLQRIGGDVKKNYKEFYMFCFGFMKNADARVMDMDTAVATWEVVLQPKFPIVGHLIEFIKSRPTYKAVNKDLWTMTLEFCYASEEKDLMDWNDDESWPSLLDEFVAWEKTRLGDSKVQADGDIVMAEH